jgi:carbamoyl-phosphate synthase large subunit
MKELNILVSSAGRRLELMQCFRDALKDCGAAGSVCAADCSLDAPAIHLADRSWQVPRCTDPAFIGELLELSVRENIHLIVPTIDSELAPLAANRELFAEHGIRACISDLDTVLICEDKVATHQWLLANDFPTVTQWRPRDLLNNPAAWRFPAIAKPRRGSASKGVRYVRSREDLQSCCEEDGLIVQSIAEGQEHTINVFMREGKCLCAVPHQRLEVRAGEVSKAVTVKDRNLMALASEIAETLPGAEGPLNIQCFRSPEGTLRVIEINSRVGGGYPLAHRAGARFAHWILEEILGLPTTANYDGWVDDLAMLRYDQAVFQPGERIRSAESKSVLVSGVGSR